MRTERQIHDEKGRFAPGDPGAPIPADWSVVTAHFLDDDEKVLLEHFDIMRKAPDMIDRCVALSKMLQTLAGAFDLPKDQR